MTPTSVLLTDLPTQASGRLFAMLLAMKRSLEVVEEEFLRNQRLPGSQSEYSKKSSAEPNPLARLGDVQRSLGALSRELLFCKPPF